MRLTCACIIYCIFVKNNCFCQEEIKPFLFEHQPETLYLLLNNAYSQKGNMSFSFSWFPIKSHLMLMACVLHHQMGSGRYMTREQEDILEKSDSDVV